MQGLLRVLRLEHLFSDGHTPGCQVRGVFLPYTTLCHAELNRSFIIIKLFFGITGHSVVRLRFRYRLTYSSVMGWGFRALFSCLVSPLLVPTLSLLSSNGFIATACAYNSDLQFFKNKSAHLQCCSMVMTSSTSSMSTGCSSPCSFSSPIMMSVLLSLFSRWGPSIPLHITPLQLDIFLLSSLFTHGAVVSWNRCLL